MQITVKLFEDKMICHKVFLFDIMIACSSKLLYGMIIMEAFWYAPGISMFLNDEQFVLFSLDPLS